MESDWSRSLWSRLTFLPVWIAFRLIWLSAKLRNDDAEAVYVAMWGAYIDLPPIARLIAVFGDDPAGVKP